MTNENENKSKTIVSEAEVLGLINNQNDTLVRYYLQPYCDDLLGTLGSHSKLVLETKSSSCNVGTTTLIRTFFVKSIPYDDPTEAAYVKQKRVFEQETAFFGSIVPRLLGFDRKDVDPWAPKCFLVRDDCLVFEDLEAKGYTLRGPVFDEKTMRSAIKSVARLHASSLLAESHLGRTIYELYPDSFREMTYTEWGKTHGWCNAGIEAAVVVADSLGLDSSKIPGLYRKMLKIAKRESGENASPKLRGTRGPRVINHGDLWSNNIMFDDTREPTHCILVDFQFTRYASPAQDLVLLLYLCSNRQFRKKFERDMIGFYHEILRETVAKNHDDHIVEVLSLERLEQEVEEQRLRAIVSAVIYSSSVYLSKRFAAEIIDDPIEYQKFQYKDRRDKVLALMEADELYRCRVEEAVRDAVEFAEKFRCDDE